MSLTNYDNFYRDHAAELQRDAAAYRLAKSVRKPSRLRGRWPWWRRLVGITHPATTHSA
ncbi:MAG: hypothetical protein ACRDWI_11980 [Jiangellaceae bacterium]